MAISVQLDAYVLPDDHSVYKFFPGDGYKFYDVIEEVSVAFLDVRGLNALEEDPLEWDDEEVLNVISEDRVQRNVDRGGDRPDKLVNSQGDKMLQTLLNGLLFTADKGDLILMPNRGYASNVLVGELLDDPGELWTVSAEDDGDEHIYYGRRVRWIGRVEKRLFSVQLVDLLQTPVAFFDVGFSNYDQVYRLVFDNYVAGNQFVATYKTSKVAFTPKDNFLTSVWLELLEVLEEAREKGISLPDGESIYALVIESDIHEDDRDDLSISIQSPGWFRIRSVVASPLASLALFALAVQDTPYDQAVAATTEAKVVREADDSCMGDVDESVRAYIELLGQHRCEEACHLAKRANADASLRADARVKTVRMKREQD